MPTMTMATMQSNYGIHCQVSTAFGLPASNHDMHEAYKGDGDHGYHVMICHGLHCHVSTATGLGLPASMTCVTIACPLSSLGPLG